MKPLIKCMLILFPLIVFAGTRYVDNFAPKGGNGSINFPYNNLIIAFQNLNPGDTLYVRGANSGNGQIYYVDIDLPKSGLSSSPIIVKNYKQENVIFSISSQFNMEKDFWLFEGITFEDNNSLIPKLKLLGGNNSFKNCIFISSNLDDLDLESQNSGLFEFCKVYNIAQK